MQLNTPLTIIDYIDLNLARLFNMTTLTNLRYLYRDCGNYKAHGSVFFMNALDRKRFSNLQSFIQDKPQFIAEQIGLPVLYQQLWRWTDGPSEDNHSWHEFTSVEIVEMSNVPIDCIILSRIDDFYDRLLRIEDWDDSLSLHFAINDVLEQAVKAIRSSKTV